MFEIRNLYKSYGQRFSLSIPSLNLQGDCRYAILGVNGSGKSTLLRIMAGLTEAEGTCAWSGAAALQPGDLGYLPQQPYAFALSVLNNVLLAIPHQMRRSQEADRALALDALDQVGLKSLANARGDRLSGGELQRMALARIFVVPRKVIMLDEPSHSLDLSGLAVVNQLLTDYVRNNNVMLILVSHQLTQLRALVDEILFIDQGQLIEQGSAVQVLEHPADPRLQLLLNSGIT